MNDSNSLSEALLSSGEAQEPESDQTQLLGNNAADYEDPASGDASSSPWERGEKQPSRFRDLPFAILFHAQFIAIIVLAITQGIPTVRKYYEEIADDIDIKVQTSTTNELSNPLYEILLAIASVTVFMVLSLSVLIHQAKFFIQCSIMFTFLVPLFVASLNAFTTGHAILGVGMLSLSGFIVLWYFCSVKRRLPLAVATLRAGVKAARSNGGIFMLAYFWGVLFVCWLLLWITVIFSTVVNGRVETCNAYYDCHDVLSSSAQIYIVLLAFSFYWTQQVCANVLRTSVAGVVGTWYFDPEDASGFCSNSVLDSTARTLTFSFGSVCLGSFLSALISTLRVVLNNLRSRRRRSDMEGISLCILDCVLSVLQRLMDYFNKWAFIYVGLYGYHYVEAGKKASKLFQQRGWTVIINDDLIGSALGLMSLTIGLLCGIVLYLVYASLLSFA